MCMMFPTPAGMPTTSPLGAMSMTLYIYAYSYAYVYIMCVYMYIYIYMIMCIYIYIYVMYICIYIYIYMAIIRDAAQRYTALHSSSGFRRQGVYRPAFRLSEEGQRLCVRQPRALSSYVLPCTAAAARQMTEPETTSRRSR